MRSEMNSESSTNVEGGSGSDLFDVEAADLIVDFEVSFKFTSRSGFVATCKKEVFVYQDKHKRWAIQKLDDTLTNFITRVVPGEEIKKLFEKLKRKDLIDKYFKEES